MKKGKPSIKFSWPRKKGKATIKFSWPRQGCGREVGTRGSAQNSEPRDMKIAKRNGFIAKLRKNHDHSKTLETDKRKTWVKRHQTFQESWKLLCPDLLPARSKVASVGRPWTCQTLLYPPQILNPTNIHLNVLFEGAEAVFCDTGVVSKRGHRGLGDGEGVLPLQSAQGDPQQVGGPHLEATHVNQFRRKEARTLASAKYHCSRGWGLPSTRQAKEREEPGPLTTCSLSTLAKITWSGYEMTRLCRGISEGSQGNMTRNISNQIVKEGRSRYQCWT